MSVVIRWWLLIWLIGPGMHVPQLSAANTATQIQPDIPLTIVLDGAGPVEVVYATPQSQVVTVTARALTPDPLTGFPLDPVLEVLSAAGMRLAYHDDVGEAAAEQDDLQPTDARIMRLVLPEAGEYRLRVNSFNGAQAGEVEVLLSEVAAAIRLDVVGDLLRVPVALDAATPAIYILSLRAAAPVEITVRDPRGLHDPMLTLYDSAGRRVASSDDAVDPFVLPGLTLNSLDAQISGFIPPADDLYTLEVREFLGRAATFELIVGPTG